MKNLSIGARLVVGISVVMLLAFSVYTAIIVNKTTTLTHDSAVELAEQMAGTYGNQVKNNIEKALDACLATGAAFVAMSEYPDKVDRNIVDEIQRKVTLSDDSFYGIQSVFEPNALDGRDAEFAGTKEWYGKNGRYGPYFWRSGEGDKLLAEDLIQYKPEETRAWYKGPRDTGRPVLTEPYVGITKTPMATVSIPMKRNGKFIGIVGIDFDLSAFTNMVKDVRPMGTGRAMVISNKGYTVAHPNKDAVGKQATEFFPEKDRASLSKALERGERWVTQMVSPMDGNEYLYVFDPINVSGVTTPWSIGIAIPMDKVNEASDSFLKLSIMLSAGTLLILLCMTLLLVRTITRPINIMVTGAQAVAAGNFDAVPSGDGFFGELLTLHGALKQMVDDLVKNIKTSEEKSAEAVEKTKEAEAMAAKAEEALNEAQRARSEGMLQAAGQLEGIALRVGQASEELSGRITDAYQGADIQRQRAAETATAMEEMNASVLEIARSAGDAADSAEDAKKNAVTGSNIVSDVVGGISRVYEETTELETGLNRLGEQAEGIGNIMTVITDIADQTNLLALNAAIEAARAGEAGRGFAVVADEVRKLAEKTMLATKEVGGAVSAIQSGTRSNIEGMQETAKTVSKTNELASKAGEALNNIMSIVEATADQVRAIATAAEQQSAASDGINQGTEEVNRIAGETAEAMEEATRAVEDLSGQAVEMSNLIEELKRG